MDGVEHATAMEKSCDPSYSHFLHNRAGGPRRGLLPWADAVPMHARPTTGIDVVAGFAWEHSPYSTGRTGLWRRHFLPPCTLLCAPEAFQSYYEHRQESQSASIRKDKFWIYVSCCRRKR